MDFVIAFIVVAALIAGIVFSIKKDKKIIALVLGVLLALILIYLAAVLLLVSAID